MKSSFSPLLIALSEGTDIPLDKPIVLIGRHQECDIQIPSRKISRRHCCIALLSDHLVIRDLGSTNGIRINGIKVVEGNLQPNDELIIGNIRYQVNWGGDAEKSDAGQTNAIKEGAPPMSYSGRHDESCDVPMPIPDIAIPRPVLPETPMPPRPARGMPVKSGSQEIPDQVNLAPLMPSHPSKNG